MNQQATKRWALLVTPVVDADPCVSKETGHAHYAQIAVQHQGVVSKSHTFFLLIFYIGTLKYRGNNPLIWVQRTQW